MTTRTPLMPRERVPALDLSLVGGGRYVLGANPAQRFDLLVFYRGLHCPVCAKYLIELERLAPEFEKRGVRSVAVSSDGPERAAKMAEKVKASLVSFAFDLPLGRARGASTSAPGAGPPPSAWRSLRSSTSRACSLSGPTQRFTTARRKRCLLLGRPSPTCSARSTSPSRRTTRRGANTRERPERCRLHMLDRS